MKFFKKVFLHSLHKYIISASFCVIILIVNLSLNNFKELINYINGFQIGGAVIFLIGGLSLVSYFGAFDTFGYAFSKLKKDPEKNYRDMYEFVTVKEEERKEHKFPFIPYFVTGLFFVLIGIFLTIFL
jgi:hypothetical protein